VEKKEGVATLTLNRPDALNAVGDGMHEELENIFLDVAGDEEINAVILTGAGRAFSAGGDVKGMAEAAAARPIPHWLLSGPRRLIHNLLEVQQPIIAAVNGDAVGLGATIALFCDIIIVAEGARIGDPHVRVGLVAGDGGAIIWPLLVGIAKAKELLLMGNLLNAQEAERIGLVNRVVPLDELMPTVNEMADRLASGPSLAIRWTKMSINRVLRERVNLILEPSLALEALSMASEDHLEATTAFVEKRRPKFKGI
jgi:enoyl-CoA hydratase/carnithine racemase